MNNQGISPYERISQMIESISLEETISEREKVELKIELFEKYTQWTEQDYNCYNELLEKLKYVRGHKGSTQELGGVLEEIVTFIFDKSFVYEVYKNKRSSTNEIDQFVVLSDKGLQSISQLGISKDILPTNQDYFLCECKNYKDKVGVTWVGKFNTLLEVSGKCNLGLIFSYEGLAGKETNWESSHGLTKIILSLSEPDKRRYILDFNIKDFELLKDKSYNIFKIIRTKKAALEGCLNSHKLLEDVHEGYEEVKSIYLEIKDKKKG